MFKYLLYEQFRINKIKSQIKPINKGFCKDFQPFFCSFEPKMIIIQYSQLKAITAFSLQKFTFQ